MLLESSLWLFFREDLAVQPAGEHGSENFGVPSSVVLGLVRPQAPPPRARAEGASLPGALPVPGPLLVELPVRR